MNYRIWFPLLLVLGSHHPSFSQVERNSDLFLELKYQDSLFFERGFNLCDIDFLQTHIADDLKFYHDLGGVQNKAQFLESTRKNLCGNMDSKPIRQVRNQSLTVFPLHENGVLYGAIQSGLHDFYIRERGKADLHTGWARFTHVWVKDQEGWMLNEVLSYDHKGVDN